MVTVEKIIAELKIGGYLDAAEYIERQFALFGDLVFG